MSKADQPIVPSVMSQEVQDESHRTGKSIHEVHRMMELKAARPKDLPENMRDAREALDEAEEARRSAEAELLRQEGIRIQYGEMKEIRDADAGNIAQGEADLAGIKSFTLESEPIFENWPTTARQKPAGTITAGLDAFIRNERWAKFLEGWIPRAKQRLAKLDADIAAFKKEHGLEDD